MTDKPPAKKPPHKRIDWDGAWKEAIQQLLPAFLQLRFPAVYVLVDWTIKPVFLEQELRQVTRRAKHGKRAVDKLARVRLLDGRQATLLIHVEFQNQVNPDLIDRLHTHNIRIYSLLQEPVSTLAVLGTQWRPNQFGYVYGGFETRMHFPIAKLLDYEAHWSVLEESDNPFAVIVMAHLKTLATMRRPETRLEWKLRLAKALYDRDYTETQVQQLVEFIDWLMVLDDQREARFDTAIQRYEEEKTMPTISPYQKRFIARGMQEGKQEAVLENLTLNFNPIPEDIIEAVFRITDRDALTKLLRAAIQVATLDEFRNML